MKGMNFQGFLRRRAVLIGIGMILVIGGLWMTVGESWWADYRETAELESLRTQSEVSEQVDRIREIRQELTRDPNDFELFLSLGNNWKRIADFTLDMRHYDKAIDAYEHAFVVGGSASALALANKAVVYTIKKEYAQAEATYRLAIEKNPGEPQLYNALVEVLRFANAEPSQIIDVFRLGMEQLVDNAPLIQSLAEYLREVGRYEDALIYYKILASKYGGFEDRIQEMEQKIAEQATHPSTP